MSNDDIIPLDLTGYRDKTGQLIPAGKYRVIVEDTENDRSAAGNTMINVWLRVVDGPSAGSVIIDRLTISPKSMFRIVGFLRAIGLPTPNKRFNIKPRQQFIGKVLEVIVEDGEPYKGVTKSEVRAYLKVKGGQPETADLDDATPAAETAPDDLSGLDEFAPPPQTATAPGGTSSDKPAAANGTPKPAPETVPVTAPDDIDLADLDL